MNLKDLLKSLKSKDTIWIIRVIGLVSLLLIIFSHVPNINKYIDKYTESVFTIDLSIKLLPITLWIIVEIVVLVPSIIEKSLKAEYKLKNPKFKEVRKEIEEKFNKSKKIRIFSYTSETLDYLTYNFVHGRQNELEVQLLCRNWKLEKEDQEKYNNSNSEVVSRKKKPWNKADIIKTRANHLNILCANTQVELNQKFYDIPPFYQGYIFDDREAYIGEYEWQKDPSAGGSQYKGVGRPLTYYSDETELGKEKIKVLVSRFEQLWEDENTRTYDQAIPIP